MKTIEEFVVSMRSNYSPERNSAADAYIQANYSPHILQDTIIAEELTDANLLSMYFKIAASKGGNFVDDAWKLFKRYYDIYIAGSHDCHDESELAVANTHILNSAKKYLMTLELFDFFSLHMQEEFLELKKIKTIALKHLASSELISDEEKRENVRYGQFSIRLGIQNNSNRSYEDNALIGPLNEEEIEVASEITNIAHSSLRITFEKLLNPSQRFLLYYFEQLKDLLLQFVAQDKHFKLSENRLRETILRLVNSKEWRQATIGYDETFLQSFNYYAAKSSSAENDEYAILERIQERDPKKRLQLKLNILDTTFDELNGCFSGTACKDNKDLLVEKLDNLCFGIDGRRWSTINAIRTNEDNKFVCELLQRYRNLLKLNVAESPLYSKETLEYYYWLFFEQTAHTKLSEYDFVNSYVYDNDFALSDLEKLLLEYIDERALLDYDSIREQRAYTALSTLLSKGSVEAYGLFRYWLVSGIYKKFKPNTKNYIEFELQKFFEARGGKKVISDLRFMIGADWERLCQEICRILYTHTLNNPTLTNGKKPDIAIGDPIIRKVSRIEHAHILVECKKSVYFGQVSYNQQDVLNNKTTMNYLEHCDILEYWILDKPQDFEELYYERVKYRFADDMINDAKIPKPLTERIRDLLAKSKSVIDYKNLSQLELVSAIDSLVIAQTTHFSILGRVR